jgi:hypothetical protein
MGGEGKMLSEASQNASLIRRDEINGNICFVLIILVFSRSDNFARYASGPKGRGWN